MAGRKIGEAFVRVRPDTVGFAKDATPGMTTAGRNLGGMFAGAFTKATAVIGVALGGLLAARKVFDIAGDALAEQREAVRISNLTAAAIKSTGGAAGITATEVSKLADRISNLVGVDDEAIQGTENLLLTFTKIRNVGANRIFDDATQAVVDMTAAMNKGVVNEDNLKAATIQVGKALNDPIKGITALRKVGVSFDEQQIKTIKHLVATGRTMDAQRLILNELKTEFAGSAAAAADPAQRASVAWANFKEQLGGFVLPVVNRLSNVFTEKIAPWLTGTLIPGIRGLGEAFKGEGVTSDGFVGAMERVGVALRAGYLFIRDRVIPVLRQLWAYIQANIIPVLQDLAERAVRGVREALADLRRFISDNRTELIQFRDGLKTVADFIVQKVLPVLGPLLSASIRNTTILIKTIIGQIVFWVRVYNEVKDAVTNLVTTTRERFDAMVAFVRSIPGRIRDAIGSMRSLLFNAGRDLVTGLWEGIQSLGGWLADKISGWVADHIPGPVRRALGIASPSKLFREYGMEVVRGFAQGVESGASLIERSLARAFPTAAAQTAAPASADTRTVQNTFNLVGPSTSELAAHVIREIAWQQGV